MGALDIKEEVQLSGEDIREIKHTVEPFELKAFFQKGRGVAMSVDKPLLDFLEHITIETGVAQPKKKVFLPVNKKFIQTNEFDNYLPLIGEKIIDITTPEGRAEARSRMALLAWMLIRQPTGEYQNNGIGELDAVGGPTVIGCFVFPDGYVRRLFVYWNDSSGKGEWYINTLKNEQYGAESCSWFSFDETLFDKVNS